MRRLLVAAVLVLGAGMRVAAAQIVDPATGMTVDAATDPMDFSAIMSGQPTNVGMEAAMAANAQMAATTAAINASISATNATMGSADASNGSAPVAVAPALPRTPAPIMTPEGGTFTGKVEVTIADRDSAAAVFYTTNGKKPTMASQRYVGPIAVSAKTKVQALAFDVSMQPSGVVSKTFKVKKAKG